MLRSVFRAARGGGPGFYSRARFGPVVLWLLASAGTVSANKVDPEAQTDEAGAAASAKIEPDTKVVYKTVGEVSLRLHIFNPPGHRPGDKTPAVIFFFGGAFRGGKASQFYGQSDHLASRGMVGVTAEYRIRNVHGTSPQTCVKDAKSAMRWVRGHATELGIAPDRIAAGGGSAGGFLAAATATLADYNEDGEDTSVSCRPDALVIFNGNFDLAPADGADFKGFAKDLADGGPEFLPIHHIAKPFPPTAFFVGTEDHLIPPASAQKIKATIENVGGRCDLHSYEGQAHGFFNPQRHDGKYFAITLAELDKFFVSLGWLKSSSSAP